MCDLRYERSAQHLIIAKKGKTEQECSLIASFHETLRCWLYQAAAEQKNSILLPAQPCYNYRSFEDNGIY